MRMNKPIVWSIAGLDGSGGAGIHADMLTFRQLGVQGCSVLTASTAQTPRCITDIHILPAEHVRAQLELLKNDFSAAAIKTGMIGSIETIDIVHAFLQTYSGWVICDPVLSATSGGALVNTSMKVYAKHLQTLYPYIDLLTPNIIEAERLTGQKIDSFQDMESAAHDLLSQGVKSVLIKGGHFSESIYSRDYWTNGADSCWLSSPRYPKKNYHGTGCIFSAAVTAALALQYSMKDALVIAKMVVTQAIRTAVHTTQDDACLDHIEWPENQIDLPFLTSTAAFNDTLLFPVSDVKTLNVYPVVDSLTWLKTLLPTGVKTLQLRIKNKNGMELENEIKQAIQIAREYNAHLYINDYWQLAIKHQAYGVHLGQEDLDTADIKAIHAAGLHLGISTHCYYEVAKAHAYRPSYMACGPIYHTTSKLMPFAPQGLQQLKRWRNTLHQYPLVAIGGVNESNLMEVAKTGVNGVAMISAITKSNNPVEKIRQLMMLMEQA